MFISWFLSTMCHLPPATFIWTLPAQKAKPFHLLGQVHPFLLMPQSKLIRTFLLFWPLVPYLLLSPRGLYPQSALHLHPFRISSHSYSMFLVTEHGHTLSYLTANCEVSRAGIKSTLLEATGAQGSDFPRPPAHVY